MANRAFRQRLRSGEPLFGLISNLDSVDLLEIAAGTGWDYVLIDTEHGAIGDERLSVMLRVLRPMPVARIVRVRDDHEKTILRACDLGADAIMVPQVETPEQAEAAVRAMRYPPLGNRGLHTGTPGSNWGTEDLAAFLQDQDEGICSLLQIETARGVRNVEAIAATRGVDCLIVGPADLSQSLGYPGQADHPAVQEAMQKVFHAARAHGIRAGTVAASPEAVRRYREWGATVFITGLIGPIRKVLGEQAAALRQSLAPYDAGP